MDPTQYLENRLKYLADQKAEGINPYPHKFSAVSVAAFAEGAKAEEARNARANIVGCKELIEEIANGNNKLKVDKCLSTPGMAPHHGKVLLFGVMAIEIKRKAPHCNRNF
ncbi:hypothetical protein AHAS_Ahas11G0098600 [Arachis hypogaea]